MRKKQRGGGEKRPFLESLSKRFEVDADMIGSGNCVEIQGRSRVEIGGVKEILSYSDDRVVLALAHGTLTVQGERLECVFYRQREAAVEGKIGGVLFGEEERRK